MYGTEVSPWWEKKSSQIFCDLEMQTEKGLGTEATSCSLPLSLYSASLGVLLPSLCRPVNTPMDPKQPPQSYLSAAELIAAWNSDSEKGITQCDWGGENSYRQGLLEGVEEMITNLGFTACFIIREVAGSSVHCLLAVLAACGRKIRNSGGFRPGFQTQLCYLVAV